VLQQATHTLITHKSDLYKVELQLRAEKPSYYIPFRQPCFNARHHVFTQDTNSPSATVIAQRQVTHLTVSATALQ